MRAVVASVVGVLALGACVSDGGVDTSMFVPRLGGDADIVASSEPDELRRLDLVATNLVAALVQVPALRPAGTTLQINAATSAFGNVLVRVLEDAGYGLQLVTADQGRRFVSYRERFAVTESGKVTDFALSIGSVELSREYGRRGENIYPSSLMSVSGSDASIDIALADEVFREQGDAGIAFISGVSDDTGIGDGSTVRTIDVRELDARPPERRSSLDDVLAAVRKLDRARDAEAGAPDLERFDRYRRTVLILGDPTTQRLGSANKRTVRLMARELLPGDLLAIRACHDADGMNEAARAQAERVSEELASLGVAPGTSWIAPCVRATYRHVSDDSPTPVELVHYRQKR